MALFPSLTRRFLLGSAGGLAATAIGGSKASAAARGRQNAGVAPSREGGAAPSPEAFGPLLTMDFGSIDFIPTNSTTYKYVGPGGVQIAAGGDDTHFNLPVGARIVRVLVFIDPQGTATGITFTRYRPVNPAYTTLGSGTSTTGSAPETVPLTVNQDVIANWNYRIDNCYLQADGQVLYGARVQYKLPE